MRHRWRSGNHSLLRARGGEESSKVTFVELFFDLVFVFAVTQLSHSLLEHLHRLGAAADDAPAHGGVVGVDLHLLGDQLARSGEDRRPADAVRADAGGPRALHVASRRRSNRRAWRSPAPTCSCRSAAACSRCGPCGATAPATTATSSASTPGSSVAAVFWIAGAFVEAEARLGLWSVALLIEYVSPSVGFWTPGLGRSTTVDWDIEGSHMAERCGLFIIIALGESILVTGAKFGNLPWMRRDGRGLRRVVRRQRGDVVDLFQHRCRESQPAHRQ